MRFLAIAIITTFTLSVSPAMAYVGPGAGLSLLGAFWGLAVAILAALAFVVVWPVRRLMRARRRPTEPATASADAPSVKQ